MLLVPAELPKGEYLPAMKRRKREKESPFGYLEWVSSFLEDLVRQRGTNMSCSLCGRRADVFHLGPGHTLLCVECAPESGDWYTVDRLFAEFLEDITVLRNAMVIRLGLDALARHTAEDSGRNPLPDVADQLAEDTLYLFGVVARLRRTASACGCPLSEDSFVRDFEESGLDPGLAVWLRTRL